MLSDSQLLRYNRQILLHDFDVAAQEHLLRSRVLVVGLGGLGCPAALYLAAAGVGQLVLADGDRVELSNLQRQIAHSDVDIGRNKAHSVADAVIQLNAGVAVEVVERNVSDKELPALLGGVDLVLDCTDNYPARFALNRACIAAALPLVSAAAVRTEGQISVFDPHRGGPCYRCLYPKSGANTALSCSESGVLAPVVGVLGSLQALEAIKVLTDFGEPLRGGVLTLDLRSMDVQKLTLKPRAACPDCSHLR